eukprot:56390-Rhodomonas_salina.2
MCIRDSSSLSLPPRALSLLSLPFPPPLSPLFSLSPLTRPPRRLTVSSTDICGAGGGARGHGSVWLGGVPQPGMPVTLRNVRYLPTHCPVLTYPHHPISYAPATTCPVLSSRIVLQHVWYWPCVLFYGPATSLSGTCGTPLVWY